MQIICSKFHLTLHLTLVSGHCRGYSLVIQYDGYLHVMSDVTIKSGFILSLYFDVDIPSWNLAKVAMESPICSLSPFFTFFRIKCVAGHRIRTTASYKARNRTVKALLT